MSYAGSFMESHRQTGILTGRVLNGEKPAGLPVQQVTKVELFINLKGAKDARPHSSAHTAWARQVTGLQAPYLLHCMSPVMALLRHHEATPSCLLPGVKRSCRKHRLRSESDPKQTSAPVR